MQMMPGVADQEVDQVEEAVKKIGSVTDYFKTGKGPEDLIRDLLEGQDPEILESRPIAYACDCSKEKVEDSLLSLGHKELEEIQDQDGQAEITCYFCNEAYHFDREDLDRLIKKSKDIDKE